MSSPNLQSQVDGATAYQDFFVPALLQQWAPRVAAAAQLQPGQRVLDVACGTGVLAREAMTQVGKSGFVAGLDPNPGMLTVARRLAPQLDWRDGIAEALPFADHSFDAVISQFGLMFFTDRRQALQEVLRVLVPGGRLAIAVWDSLENTPAYSAVVALLDRVAGPSAAGPLRAPFVLGDPMELEGLFAGAGVDTVTVTTHHGSAKFPSIRSMLEADLRGWLPVVGVVLSEDVITRILEEAEHSLGEYVTSDGRVEYDTPAHIVTGRRS